MRKRDCRELVSEVVDGARLKSRNEYLCLMNTSIRDLVDLTRNRLPLPILTTVMRLLAPVRTKRVKIKM